MTDSKPNKDERKSLKASQPVWKRIVLLQRSMEDPETLKRPSREEVVEMAVGALERERLNQSTPINGKSLQNSLTSIHTSEILAPRPSEKEWIEKLGSGSV